MKTRTIAALIFIITALVSCAPIPTVARRSDNFAFVYQDYSCGLIPVHVLDTTSDTLVYAPLGDPTSITVPFQLTDDELESVYQKAVFIGFFDYPSKLLIPDDQVLGYQAPASSYELSMTNGEMTHSVSWTDDTMTKPGYTKADQLRELMKMIDKIIQSHPEVEELPGSKAGCS